MEQRTNWRHNYEHKLDEKKMKELDRARVYCECGYSLHIPATYPYVICKHCGKKVLNNSKARFSYLLRKELNKNDR